MYAALLMSAMLLAQAPDVGPTPSYRWHSIRHEGLAVNVWGYKNEGGKVVWYPDAPENIKAMAAAREESRRSREVLNFGVAPGMIGRRKDYTADSDAARRFVEEATRGGGAPQSYHVTVIGSVDDCAPVLKDIKADPAFASIRDRLMVQDYRPGEWAVDPKLGYQAGGKPTILVQTSKAGDDKGGRVVFRAMDYSRGAAGLAEAIRKADPDYAPSKDPGPDPGGHACPLGFTTDSWAAVLIVGVAVAAILFLPPKEPKP